MTVYEFLNKLKNKVAENKLKGDLKKNPVKFLGLEHEYRPNSVLIHQETSVLEYINKVGLNRNSNPVFTPCDPHTDERKQTPNDAIENTPQEHKIYQSETGHAIWLMRARLPEIYAINCRTNKMAASTKFDHEANKRLGRHLLVNPREGITFHAGHASFNPITYAYVDASLMDRSISGIAVFIGIPNFKTHENLNGAVLALTKTEPEAVTSTMHSEMIVIERA